MLRNAAGILCDPQIDAPGLKCISIAIRAPPILPQNGCSVRIVQELLGHRKIDTTGIYTHLKTGDMRKAVERNHLRGKKPQP
jgi:hypothetical protein